MVLLLHEDLADLLCHGKFAERFALPDALLVIDDGLILVIEIELHMSLAFSETFTGFGVTLGILPR